MKQNITVNSRKFDNKIYRSWETEIVNQNNSLIILKGIFSSEVIHSKLGLIKKDTISYEYFWLDRWYSVFHFFESSGEFRNFYCNINQPPSFKRNILDFIDLDIDVLVCKDFTFEILDLDEYKENSVKFGYSAELKKKVENALSELINIIEMREFPFDKIDQPNISSELDQLIKL